MTKTRSITEWKHTRTDKNYRLIKSNDTTYLLIPGHSMVKIKSNEQFGYTSFVPDFYYALSRPAIRRMFTSNRLQGRVGQWRYDRLNENDGDGRLCIGCQVFVGHDLKGLKRWAGFNV